MKKPTKKSIQGLLVAVLAVLAVCLYPPIFLYSANAAEAAFTEIISVALLFCGIGLVCYGVVFALLCLTRTTAKTAKAAIITSIIMLVGLNYSLIEDGIQALFVNLKYWHIVPLLVVIILHIAYFVVRFTRKDTAQMAAGIICLVFSALLVVNIATCIPQAIGYYQAQQDIENAQQETEAVQTASKKRPNVYYFLFDEYAGFEQMEQYYQYDNAILRDFFDQNNFSVSTTTRNESITTTTIVTNIMNLDYVVSDSTPAGDKEYACKNGEWYRLMQENGYQVKVYDSTDFIGPASLVVSNKGNSNAHTMDGEDLRDICIKQTVAGPFYTVNHDEAMQQIHDILDSFADSANYEASNTFSVVYLCFPHHPFLVDENGQMNSSANWYNWEDDQFYLGQYKYATKKIIETAENIIRNDPDSIIIFQSDHGARGGALLYVKFPYEAMNNTLNAVYYGGEKMIDIEGLSSVNTIRIVMNELLGTTFDIIDMPKGE